MPKLVPRIDEGDVFGKLTVVDPTVSITGNDGRAYKACRCVCDCGNTVVRRHSVLRAGYTQSCGCLNSLASAARCRGRAKHGMGHTPEYKSWGNIRDRCLNTHSKDYPSYGVRGITVHPDWVGEGGFERFYAHIGPRPSPEHSVDRINNDGNYEPGNVRWATQSEQQNNRRACVFLAYNGVTDTLSNWARKTGIQKGTIAYRLRAGWSVVDALTQPIRKQHLDN